MERIGKWLKRVKLQHIILLVICCLINPMVKADSFYAEVKKIKGVATVEGEKLKVGDKISAGKVISAKGKGNFIDLKFSNGTAMRIVGGELRVERKQKELSVYNVLAGKVFSYFEKSDKDKHVVKTRDASFAIRGTRFLAEQQEDKSFLCVCEGVVEASNDTGLSVRVPAGKEVFVSKGDREFVNKVAVRDMTKLKSVFKKMGYPVD